MATTQYGVNHPLAVKVWSTKLMREALKETFASRFMGRTKDSLIYVKDELTKGPGDRITSGLRVQLSGDGIAGDGTLEGNEEALVTYNDNLFIDQLRHAVRSDGRMSEQRIPFSIREESMDGLRDWWADRIDTAFFNQIAGNTGQSDTRYTGLQAAIAASTDSGNTRIIFGPGAATTENSLSASESTSANFQLTMIDKAINIAKTAVPLIRPLVVNGAKKYVAFLHPNQVYNLRTDATAARVTWYDTQRALVEGGKTDSPIYNGAMGEYNGVILHESTRVPLAPSTTTVRRAIFCGAQAACFATGRENPSDQQMTWVEELFDYGNQLGVSAGLIFGLKKSRYNAIDFGTIVMASHAEAP
mgnify:CR=1 FL=1|jgi:N4-gp56 family major capsid protein